MTDPTAPGPQEGEIDFTVESLDGRSRLPVRACVAAAWLRRHHPRRPAWLTRRADVAALTMVLVGVYLLWATGLAGQWWQQGRLALLWHFAPTLTQTAIVPAAPGTLQPPGAWQRILPPPTADWVLSLDVSPADPQAAWVCTGPKRDSTTVKPTDGPIALWRTSDGGQHWQPLPIPARTGTYCEVQMATGVGQGQRLLLTVFGSGGCQTSHPLLSTDAGQHWHSLSPPLPPLPDKMRWCWLSAAVTPRHIFVAVEYSVLVCVTTTHTSTRSGASSGSTSFN